MINYLKAPFLFVSRFLGSKEQFSGYTRHSTSLSPEEARSYIPLTAINEAAFSSNPDKLKPYNFKFLRPDLPHLSKTIEVRDRVLLDKETGLKISLIQDETKTYVVFGPYCSFNHELDDEKEKRRIGKIQYRAGVKNVFGLNNKIFDRAEKVFEEIEKKYSNVHLIGSSLGGCLAAYVGLRKKVKTTTLNALPLGVALQQKIGKKNLHCADHYIENLHAEKDMVSDHPITNLFNRILSFLRIRTPGLFGKRFSIPSAYKDSNSTHQYIMGSLMKHLGYDPKTQPHEMVQV